MVWAHEELGRDEMIHLIDPANERSERVARRLCASITGRHEFPNDIVANIWTSRWETFTASEPYRHHIAASGATA
jgi:RimJ/RimL family protein N-acetyltransferase